MSDRHTKLVIAAIDFGTTYSGYAYSFQHTLERDPLKVYANIWTDEHGKLQTTKAPTAVLFKPDGEFDSFGFEAEQKYAELADDDEHRGWRYFKHFKMKLHGQNRLRRDMKIKDDQGNRMTAVDVFAAAIKFLKDELLVQIQRKAIDILETDIHWVITVPAIWQYSAKQFMKEASLRAGIPIDQFTFALEPEAAAIYCKQYEVSKCEEDGHVRMTTFAPGSQFMVLDMGGGTVDITVSEVQADGSLKELHYPSGGPWGGTLVDKEFLDFFEEVFGSVVWNKFKSEKKLDYIELLVTIESKKRQLNLKQASDIRIPFPRSLEETLYKVKRLDIGTFLSQSGFAETVKVTKDKLKIKTNRIVQMFENPKQLVEEHLQKLLSFAALKNVSTVMMVGGLSESPVMYTAIQQTFPHKHVIVPEEAGTVVMKGIVTAVPFDPKVHPPGMEYTKESGEVKIDDVFHQFIKKGQDVFAGESKIEHSFMTPRAGEAAVEIYQTPADILPDPSFVFQPGFERIGELRLSPQKPGLQQIDVTMTFGGIDLEVEAKEHGTNNCVKAKFDFLH